MDVDSLKATESRQETTQHFSFDEDSSAQAAAAPPPYGLTPEAQQALREEGAQVLVYSGSRRMLFSESAPIGPAAPPVESDGTDFYADVDPEYHILIVQQGQRKIYFRRPTEDMHFPACGRSIRKRKQQLLEKEGGSCEKPDVKLPSAINLPETVLQNNNSSLIVIKKVSGNNKLRPSPSKHCPIPTLSIEQLMKLAREKDEGCALGVVFVEGKLSASASSALPLVPSLHSHLPWFYMANPGTSQGNCIFGNMTARQSFLVANSDLQSSSCLLYSKDGWLLLRGRERLYFGLGFPRYPVFLLNPTTGARMDLPSIHFPRRFAAFCTTTQGTPEVVTYVHSMGGIVKVYMVRPGGAYWEEHPYVFSHVGIGRIGKVVLCGGSVYCFFPHSTASFSSLQILAGIL